MRRKTLVVIACAVIVGATLLPATRDELTWLFASWRDEAPAYERYVVTWPEGRHVTEARSRFDERSWRDARAADTLDALARYSQTHPTGVHSAESLILKEELTWQQSTNANTIESFEAYSNSYQTGRFAAIAQSRVEELTWEKAARANAVESLQVYITRYETGRFSAMARGRVEELTWQQSTNRNTIQSLEAYLKGYENGKFASLARSRMEELYWHRAISGNTLKSLRTYLDAYPEGRYLAEAKTREAALRSDDAPFAMAVGKGTERALEIFVNEYPGHVKEAEARQAIKEITDGRDIVDLLAEKKIEIRTQGSGIESVSVRIRRLVPYPLTVRVPVGSYFVSTRPSAQNMVTTQHSSVTLWRDEWREISVPAACANRPKTIPNTGDSFTVQRSAHNEELTRLMPVLYKASANQPTRQAAVWIVTDDASYSELGVLVSGPNRSIRSIRTAEAGRAMQLCAEAGIDITRKRIWADRETIAGGAIDGELKKWLELKR